MRSIKARMTMEIVEFQVLDRLFLGIPDYSEQSVKARDLWCELNPWSKRRDTGPQVLVYVADKAFDAAAKCERLGLVCKVVRLTIQEVHALNRWDRRYNEKGRT